MKSRFLKDRPIGLIVLIFVAFIALGMPDGLLGVGWPSIREGFKVPLDSIGALLFVSMAGYLTSSFLSGAITNHWGVAKLLVVSCLMTGVGLIGYTLVPSWWMMVLLAVLSGAGAGAIDAGLNAYVARYFGPGLMQWLHASYGVGVTTGPLLMTFALVNLQSWRPGYLVVGGFQILLATSFWISMPVWQKFAESKTPKTEANLEKEKTKKAEIGMGPLASLRQPRVLRSILLFFLYCGAESTMGIWVYTLLTEGRGVSPEAAGLLAGSYWLTFTIGRILAGLLTSKLNIQTLVKICMVTGLVGGLILWINVTTWLSLISVALIGFAFAPIFPGLVSGTSRRVGSEHTNNAIGIQITAGNLGATTITSLTGVLAKSISLETIPIVLVVLLTCLLVLFLIIEKTSLGAELSQATN